MNTLTCFDKLLGGEYKEENRRREDRVTENEAKRNFWQSGSLLKQTFFFLTNET